jgi:CBS domain-containing protein
VTSFRAESFDAPVPWEGSMRAADVMTRDVFLIGPSHSIRMAALLMSQHSIGALPVREKDRLVGMITDRDIAIRSVADGQAADTKVRDVMTKPIKYCFEDDELESVCENMASNKIRRLPVLDRNKRLVGIVCIGDVARWHGAGAGEVLAGMARQDKAAAAE